MAIRNAGSQQHRIALMNQPHRVELFGDVDVELAEFRAHGHLSVRKTAAVLHDVGPGGVLQHDDFWQ